MSLLDGCSDSTDTGADTLGAARKAGLHLNCNHDDSPLSAADCLQSCVGAPRFCCAPSYTLKRRAVAKYAARRFGGAGERNAEHYFVATQDRALRVALGQQPGGASIFCSVNGVHLEPPSEAQKAQLGQARPPATHPVTWHGLTTGRDVSVSAQLTKCTRSPHPRYRSCSRGRLLTISPIT